MAMQPMLLGAGGALAAIATGVKWYFTRYEQWECVATHPQGRYLYGGAILDRSLVLVGGLKDGGTYLNDVLSLDLRSFTWCAAEPCPVSCAGHSMIVIGGELLVFVGIPSVQTLRVYKFSTTWTPLPTAGDAPLSTRGHSATLIGNTVWVIGGEDYKGRLVNDIHVLNAEEKTWEKVHASGSVILPPISYHSVVPYKNCLYLFGGRTSSGVSASLFVLDCNSLAWSMYPDGGTAREKFGAAVIGNKCYTLGGGASEVMILNLDTMQWKVASAEPQLAGRGLVLVSSSDNKAPLLAAARTSNGGFGVFALRACKQLPQRMPGFCQVKAVDGSEWTPEVPEEGKLVREMMSFLDAKTGYSGSLRRQQGHSPSLTPSDKVSCGDELTYQFSVTLRGRQDVEKMSVVKCRAFLSQMGVNVSWGSGWLEPTREMTSPDAFNWQGGRKNVQSYLDQVGGLLIQALDTLGYDTKKWKVKFESLMESLCIIEGRLLMVRMSFVDPFCPMIGLFLRPEISEESRWRAAVMLLAFSIQSPYVKPWMVISDLQEVWEFAWMDGLNMFVSRASSGKQGRGILRDLLRDYHKILDPYLIGALSSLPSAFEREEITCYESAAPPKPRLSLLKKTPLTGGMHIDATDEFIDYGIEECYSYPDEDNAGMPSFFPP